jgi:hypothetical protein
VVATGRGGIDVESLAASGMDVSGMVDDVALLGGASLVMFEAASAGVCRMSWAEAAKAKLLAAARARMEAQRISIAVSWTGGRAASSPLSLRKTARSRQDVVVRRFRPSSSAPMRR